MNCVFQTGMYINYPHDDLTDLVMNGIQKKLRLYVNLSFTWISKNNTLDLIHTHTKAMHINLIK